jgi:hypothetical protein
MSHGIKDANICGRNVVDSDEWIKSNTKPVLKDSCSSSEVKVFLRTKKILDYECSFVKINSHFL